MSLNKENKHLFTLTSYDIFRIDLDSNVTSEEMNYEKNIGNWRGRIFRLSFV